MRLAVFIRAIIAGIPRSPENWRKGDLAICIDDRWATDLPANPKKDDLVRVSGVRIGQRYLDFEGKPPNIHWQASAFRKVQPDVHPAADAAWVEQLHHLRRKEPA